MPNYSRQDSEVLGKLGNIKSFALSVPPNLSELSKRVAKWYGIISWESFRIFFKDQQFLTMFSKENDRPARVRMYIIHKNTKMRTQV